MRLHTFGFGTIILSAFLATNASAAVIAGYDFGTIATGTLSATTLDPNASATALTPGSNTTVSNTQNGNNYSSPPYRNYARTNLGTGTAAAPDQSNVYVQFTVTPAAGYELDLTSFSFDGSQGGGTAGTRRYAIYTSVDGLALTTNTDIASGPTLESAAFTTVRGGATAAAVMPTYDVDLSDARFQNLTSPLTVRVYFYAPDNGQSIDVDNFVLNGTVSAVPEPASVAALAAACGAALVRRRRHA